MNNMNKILSVIKFFIVVKLFIHPSGSFSSTVQDPDILQRLQLNKSVTFFKLFNEGHCG